MNKSSLNRAVLVGRVGDKPEGRYTPKGTSMASFSIATNEMWGNGEDRQEHTEWHNIVTWGKSADFVSDFIQKGQLICIEGRLKTRSWKDKEDNTRKTTEIVASSITPLEWKKNGAKAEPGVSEPNDDEEDLPF